MQSVATPVAVAGTGPPQSAVPVGAAPSGATQTPQATGANYPMPSKYGALPPDGRVSCPLNIWQWRVQTRMT